MESLLSVSKVIINKTLDTRIENDPSNFLSYHADSPLQAWVANKITIAVLWMQSGKRIPEDTLRRIFYFLEELEHHFLELSSESCVWEVIQRFKLYLNSYPYVTQTESTKAHRMTEVICRAFGLNFRANFKKFARPGRTVLENRTRR